MHLPAYDRRAAPLCGALTLAALACGPALAQDAQQAGEAQRLVWLLLLPAIAVSGGLLQAVVSVLFPRWTEATRTAISTRRGLCLGWGAAIAALAFIILAIGSAVQGGAAFIAGVLVLLALLLSVAGYVGIAAAMGEALLGSTGANDDRTPLQTLVGGLTLCFACLTPVLGQILAFLLLLASLGAAVVGLCLRPEVPEEAA